LRRLVTLSTSANFFSRPLEQPGVRRERLLAGLDELRVQLGVLGDDGRLDHRGVALGTYRWDSWRVAEVAGGGSARG
jgi:hypothetical protein